MLTDTCAAGTDYSRKSSSLLGYRRQCLDRLFDQHLRPSLQLGCKALLQNALLPFET
jgi:hypothetical protein